MGVMSCSEVFKARAQVLKILSNPDNTATEPSFFDVQPLTHVP